jgi:hypothetical protein
MDSSSTTVAADRGDRPGRAAFWLHCAIAGWIGLPTLAVTCARFAAGIFWPTLLLTGLWFACGWNAWLIRRTVRGPAAGLRRSLLIAAGTSILIAAASVFSGFAMLQAADRSARSGGGLLGALGGVPLVYGFVLLGLSAALLLSLRRFADAKGRTRR